MASETLRRNPTSTGNRRVFTWAGWVKFNKLSTTANCIWYAASSGSSEFNISLVSSTGAINVYDYAPSAYQYQYVTSRLFRDFSNWFHLVVAVDTTQFREDDRFKIYVNGVLYNGSYSTETTAGGINHQTRMNTPGEINVIGQNTAGGSSYDANCELTDLFLVDGQALTPDVFGFYKQGNGYISAGSTQATDFRPGQWVPKTPRVIKTEINRRGGFGVNGFYLPMNDYRNFGADFHGEPNSIITLNEKLPQPRVGVASTAAVGLGYTDVLRADPYAANLVLAIPGVIGGQGSGYGDYSANIKGSGSNKTVTANGNAGVAVTASYYGSALSFDGSGDYFSIPDTEDFEFGSGDYTVEFWVNCKRATSGTIYYEEIVTKGWPFQIYRDNTGKLFLAVDSNTSAYDFNLSFGTPGVGDWAHVCVERHSGTSRMYLNGVVGALSTASVTINNTSSNFTIGDYADSQIYPFTGYIQDLRIYKGIAKYKGGFDVPKPYTPVGIATWRAVTDTTANNFCTWNPLSAFDGAQSNGNLTSTTNDLMGTVGVSTGKWYWEIYDTTAVGGGGNVMHHGVSFTNSNQAVNGAFNSAAEGKLAIRLDANNQSASGTTITLGTQTGTVPTYSNGDIYSIALDLNSGICTHYRNGSTVLTTNFTYNRNTYAIPYTRNNGLSCSANFGQNPTFSGNTTAGTFTDSSGKGLFKYQPPSGFLALCEDNLPTPAIKNPGEHFKTVLWTGDGNSGRSIVGVGFTPDLVWVKNRTGTQWHILTDSVRGPVRNLFSNATNAEVSPDTSGYINSFSSDGFSVQTGSVDITNFNSSGNNYVAWCWKAGAGTTSTNTNGSITSVVSVNQDAGFSIVSYTGTGPGNFTVGHGLGKVPSMIILKNRDRVLYWNVYTKMTGKDAFLRLNTTDASTASSNLWGTSNPTSLVFGGAGTDNSNGYVAGERIIAYCWAEIEGFSKFGSYVGNGNADGPVVYCGFKPAFILLKKSSTTGNWNLFDSSRNSTNPVSSSLFANLSNIENTTSSYNADFLSNGFKVRTSDGSWNDNGVTYIFAAWAESPFTTANAK